jgi:hypothetical protein
VKEEFLTDKDDEELRDGKLPENDQDTEQEESVNYDWKSARGVLKKLAGDMDDSIDWYFKKRAVNILRERFNAKERSAELFAAIMRYKED